MNFTICHLESFDFKAHPPLGVAYIASYLKKYLKFDNTTIIVKQSDMEKSIIKQKPDILGISAVTIEFKKAVKLAESIKENLDIPIIIGGSHITGIPYILPKSMDIGVIGEAEETMLELLDMYIKTGEFKPSQLKNIDGICFHDGKRVVINRMREFIEPLDKIPYPARELLDMEKNYLTPTITGTSTKIKKSTYILTSRGCPYNCVFCTAPLVWRRRLRFHSAEYVVGEIKQLVETYGLDEILIFDDLFTANKKRLREIVKLIREEKLNDRLTFTILSRSDTLDEEICQLLKNMNVKRINFGFESGSPRILKYLKRNTVTVEHNKRAIKLAKKHNFVISGYFMIGSPHETKEDMMLTLKFIKNNPIDLVTLCVTTAYPGTDIWEYAKKEEFVSDDMDWEKLYNSPRDANFIFLNKEMTKSEFLQIRKMIEREIGDKIFEVDFKITDVLSSYIIKYIISHPSEAWKYFYYSKLKGMVNRLSNRTPKVS